MENSKIENLFENELLLTDLQKSELDKSLAEIEKGTIQAEDWKVVRKELFTQYNINF